MTGTIRRVVPVLLDESAVSTWLSRRVDSFDLKGRRWLGRMDYHFRPLGKTCAGTGKPFAPGARIVSVLVEQNGVLNRLDFAAEAWPGPSDQTVGHWYMTIPEGPPQRRPLDPEAMFRYFEQLTEDANPGFEKLRYVLALFLLQKRRMKLDGARTEDGVDYLVLVGNHGEGPYDVRDQQMSQEEVTQLQAALHQQMEAEWQAA